MRRKELKDRFGKGLKYNGKGLGSWIGVRRIRVKDRAQGYV